MRENVIDFRTKEQRRAEFKEKIHSKIQSGKEWFEQNKEVVITLTPVVIGGVATITKVVGKHINLNKEESVKNCNRQIMMRSDIKLPQPFASWSNSL